MKDNEMKEKLVSLLKGIKYPALPSSPLLSNLGDQFGDHVFEIIAEHLLENGVTFS